MQGTDIENSLYSRALIVVSEGVQCYVRNHLQSSNLGFEWLVIRSRLDSIYPLTLSYTEPVKVAVDCHTCTQSIYV